MPRDTPNIRPLCLYADLSPAIVEPPTEEILFAKSILRHLVIDHGGWFISQPLSRLQHPIANFRVFVADLTAGSGPQVRAKAPVLFKHLLGQAGQLYGIGPAALRSVRAIFCFNRHEVLTHAGLHRSR